MHTFMHTFTHSCTHPPTDGGVSGFGAVRVRRRLAQGHLLPTPLGGGGGAGGPPRPPRGGWTPARLSSYSRLLSADGGVSMATLPLLCCCCCAFVFVVLRLRSGNADLLKWVPLKYSAKTQQTTSHQITQGYWVVLRSVKCQ